MIGFKFKLMELNELQERIYKYIIDSLNIGEKKGCNNSFSELVVDSISFVKLVVSLENEFEFEFDDEMLYDKQFNNIIDIVNYVEMKICSND